MDSSDDGKSYTMPVVSPLQEHLYTNYVPTDAEIDSIRADLPQHEAELVRLDALIRDLTARRKRIKSHIDSHRALISYPRRLPQDIVEQIFLACLPAEGYPRLISREAPLVLGQICGLWRSIAFGMPSLWSCLDVSMRNPYRDFSKHREAIIDWLSRSRENPLAISTLGESMYWEHYHQIFVQFSRRIRCLHISDMTLAQFFFLADLDVPLLEEIRFSAAYPLEGLGQRTEILASKLFRGRNLRRVTIYAEESRPFVPTTPFIWDHLTDLSLVAGYHGALYCTTAHRLLKGCPNLRSLKFAFETQWSEDENFYPTEHLTLQCLEALAIFISYTDDISHVYKDLIDLPRLTSFHLSHSPTIPRSSFRSALSDLVFLDHLAARSPEIVDLTLDVIYSTKTSSVYLLELFPRLERLHLIAKETYTFGDTTHGQSKHDVIELIKLLTSTPPGQAGRLCPVLRELVLESEWNVTEFAEVVIDFLRIHLDSGTPLRRFEIRCLCDPQGGGVVPDFQPFRRRGLIVDTAYTSPPPGSAFGSIPGSVVPRSAFGGM